MKLSFSKLIPLTAGTITITNFLFSLVPVASNTPEWYKIFLQGINPEFRFIVFTLFTLVFSFSVVKLITAIDKSDSLPSSKMTFVVLLCASFAWIVVFNIKLVALGNNISNGKMIIFIISSWMFSMFLGVKLHFDFKAMKYENYRGEVPSIWSFIDKGFYTPVYIRTIRFISFWFIIILGGIVYEF